MGVIDKQTLVPYTFKIVSHLLSFSWQIIHLKNVDDFYEEFGVSGKVYVLYNYDWPLLDAYIYAWPLKFCNIIYSSI